MKIRFLAVPITVFFFLFADFAFAQQESKILRFGVLSFRPKDITMAQWLPLTKELERTLPEYSVELLPMNYAELDKAAQEHKLDFVLTNPEHYILLKNKLIVNAVATMITLENNHPMTQFAGVIFTRADRTDIQTLADLNGKIIASPAEGSLGGYLMQRWELEKNNVKVKQYHFTGMPHDKAVEEVLKGKADAGFVRSGVLEDLARAKKISLNENPSVRILAAHAMSERMPVLYSTDCYPEWPFTVSQHISPEITRKVSLALLNLKADSYVAQTAGIAGFNSPADYTPVEILMLRLRSHPDDLKYFNFADVVWRYREFVVLCGTTVFLVFILVIFLIRANQRYKKLANENKKLSLAVEQCPAAIVITDLKARIEYVNQAFTDHTGYQPSEVIGKNPSLLRSGKTDKLVFLYMWQALAHGKSYRCEMINHRKDGSEYTELALITPIRDSDGQITHYLGIKQDITEHKKAERIILDSYQYARTLIETSLDPLVTISAEGKITDVNTATENVTGVARETLIGSDFADYFTDPQSAREVYQQVFLEGVVIDYPLAIRHVSGKVTDVLYNASLYFDSYGEVQGVFAAARDITERKKAEEQIKQLAFFDSLTGLPNRRKLLDCLGHAISLGHREKKQFAVFMMDLDKFKAVNDTFGHAAGDDLLQQVAIRIKHCLRDSDTVARLGGDEFVVLLETLSVPKDATQVATKIITNLAMPFELSCGEVVQIGVSIGISLYPQDGQHPETLLDHADMALYQAKDNGRSCFAYYS